MEESFDSEYSEFIAFLPYLRKIHPLDCNQRAQNRFCRVKIAAPKAMQNAESENAILMPKYGIYGLFIENMDLSPSNDPQHPW